MASEPQPAPPPLDEDQEPGGGARADYRRVLDALRTEGLASLASAVARHLAEHEVTFGGAPFVMDPVPRLITAAEWDPVQRGLIQRAAALNAFLHDAYGDRRIVAEGMIAAEVIDGAEGFEPDMRGRLPAGVAPAAVIGFDLVRDPDGEFLVLEDNLRTPSGMAYLLAARAALAATLPAGLPAPRPIRPLLDQLLGATLRSALPPGDHDRPVIVLVSDGPGNVAFYEHSALADGLGIPLVTPGDLVRNGDTLFVRLPGSAQPRRVDVVYRRTDEDRVRDEHGRFTAIADLLVEPWCSGRLGLINAFGTGVADDKLLHGHVETFIRFYLEQEPVLRSVPTLALDSPEAAATIIDRLPELVVKPRHGHGGRGVVIGSRASRDELARVADDLRAHPGEFIAQPIVPLSRHPTVIDGRLEPRHLDLRPFAFSDGAFHILPGGLSRVAFDAGEMVVNSSQNGGGKDTWVVD
jgi:uncharacterized circularly permuted ATP-grasp superfamily protein